MSNRDAIRRVAKLAAILAVVSWETWWAYTFFSAPDPDYEMASVWALLMGFWLPLLVACFVVSLLILRSIRRKRRGD